MSFNQANWVWMNGRFCRWNEATVNVSAHALHYGSGIFEGLRCYETSDGPAVFRMDAHLDRLQDSAAVYGMEIPYTREEIAEIISEVIRRNEFDSCYIRPIIFFGSGSLGLHPMNCPVEMAILAWPWSPLLGTQSLVTGVRVTVSSWTKFHSSMMPATAKACGQYLNSILAVREAVSRGYDEALLLDAEGCLAEGPGENLFIVRGDSLYTNDERSSLLLGITRASAIEIARNLDCRVEIQALTLEDLLSADEAFFTGTAAEVTPIREVDGKPIGSGERGPVTEKIQRDFFAATSGRDPRYRDWLHFVSHQ
ncbi:MAG: branched-chain amino acid transaminase, partial [Blastocatellia bacterium]|nr:branched-chain amino acid transaminase [Blastocatellia bacterium]